MKKVLTLFMLVHFAHFGFAQDSILVTTIPLERLIKVELTSVDTSSLTEYTLYQFNYDKGDSAVRAQFWTASSDSILELGECEVELCSIVRMNLGNNTELRGHGIASRLTIRGTEADIKFNFNEYGEFPTLRLCSTP